MNTAVQVRIRSEVGIMPSHARRISWSKRKRGRVQRSAMPSVTTAAVFAAITPTCASTSGSPPTSGRSPGMNAPSGFTLQPPRNSTQNSAAPAIMLKYSARKNSAKRMLEYSVWYPPTSSLSHSARSNGRRFVSASMHT